MNRKRLLLGSIGLSAATAVGIGAVTLAAGGSSLASNSVPTSQVATTTTSPTNGSNSTSTPPRHRGFGFFRGPGAVYSESVLPQQGGGYKTVIEVRGALSAISSSSISVTRPDTGATVTAAITSSTRFGNTSESALAADLSSHTSVTVRLIETSNNAVSVSVPPPPGTHPKPGTGWARGTFPPRNHPASNSSTSA